MKKLYALLYTNNYEQTLIVNLSMGGRYTSCEFTDDLEHVKQVLQYITRNSRSAIQTSGVGYKILEAV